MKSTEYKVWLERHQLTHEVAGKALGVHKSTSKRYCDGTIKIPLTIEPAIEAAGGEMAACPEGVARLGH